jgi:hypothetical protein
MRILFLVAAIAVLGLATACTVKRETDQRPARDRTPVETPDPNSWLLNPPQQGPR